MVWPLVIEWVLRRPLPELIAAVAALVTAVGGLLIAGRAQSNMEHRKTFKVINKISDQMDDGNGGGLLARVAVIEKVLGIEREEHP